MEERKVPLSSPDITKSEIQEVVSVLKTPYLSRGPKTREFEEKMASFMGVPYGISVNSGTSGLHLAVKSLGLKEGDFQVTEKISKRILNLPFYNNLSDEDIEYIADALEEATMVAKS